MTVSVADRVWETAAAPGTGNVSMGGAKTGYQAFSAAFSSGNTIYYAIVLQGGALWEVGENNLTSGSPWTLARSAPGVLAGSSGVGALVNFTSGTVDVFCDGAPAAVVALIYAAVQSSRQITAGTGLAGGGDLSADRSLALASITAAILAATPFGPFTTIASATTTDLSTVATVGVSISGTTTITGFGTGADLFRVGKFAGALTLTHNATSLILPGAANITTAAGDRFIALSDGSGNWTVVDYTKADGTPVVGAASVFSRTGAVVAASGDYTIAGNTVALPRSYLAGLATSNNGGTPNSKIDVAAGACRDDTDAFNIVFSASKTINCATTGADALDVGALGISLWYHAYGIAKADGTMASLASLAPSVTATITVTIASPGVVTWTGHGLGVGAPVAFTTTGALPTGITAATTYYVKTVVDVNSFQIAATQGGTVINTSGSQSGVHTGTSTPTLPTGYIYKRRVGSFKTDGSAHILAFNQNGDEFLWAAPVGDVSVTNLSTTAVSYTLTTPLGLECLAIISGLVLQAANAVVLLTALDTTDTAPNVNYPNTITSPNAQYGSFQMNLRTNTSSQIRARSGQASTTLGITTLGWMDQRGRNA